MNNKCFLLHDNILKKPVDTVISAGMPDILVVYDGSNLDKWRYFTRESDIKVISVKSIFHVVFTP